MAQKEGKAGAKTGPAKKRATTATKQAKSTRSAAGTKDRKLPTAARVRSRKQPTTLTPQITRQERQRMIAEAAYYRAERRGFSGGDSVHDWLAAEAEVDALLQRMG